MPALNAGSFTFKVVSFVPLLLLHLLFCCDNFINIHYYTMIILLLSLARISMHLVPSEYSFNVTDVVERINSLQQPVRFIAWWHPFKIKASYFVH